MPGILGHINLRVEWKKTDVNDNMLRAEWKEVERTKGERIEIWE